MADNNVPRPFRPVLATNIPRPGWHAAVESVIEEQLALVAIWTRSK
jgi:hypothetical protein